MKRNEGFTLIELMIVISIIGILAAIAIPQFSKYRERAYVSEGYSLVSSVRRDVQEYRDVTGVFPEDNAMAGLAEKDAIKGKYVDAVSVDKGTITVTFNDSREGLSETFIRLIPVVPDGNPTGSLIWQVEREPDK